MGPEMRKTQQFAPGDRVRYSPVFLRSIGSPPLWARERGTIIAATPLERAAGRYIVTVKWDDGETRKSLNVNLAPVRR